MKPIYFLIISFLIFSGCSFGKPSTVQGSAKFTIPFDFGLPDKEGIRKERMAREMERLEAQKSTGDESLQMENDSIGFPN